MVKINPNKRINNDLIKNKSKQNKINIKNSKNISKKIIKKNFKKIKSIKKSLNLKNNNNNENNINNNNNNNTLDYSNIYNNNFLKNDIFYVMRCYDCSFIPLIKIKYSQISLFQNKDIFFENNGKFAMVQMFCQKGHTIVTSLKQYLLNCKINHNFLSLCGECHESKSNELFNYSFCKKCKKTLCKKCSENHIHNNNISINTNDINIKDVTGIENLPQGNLNPNTININNNMNNNNIISIYELDFYCHYHKQEFNSFCKDCNKNLCILCENNHNKMHKRILYIDIKLNNDEIKNIEYNIDLAKKRVILFEIKILNFIRSLFQLQKIYQQLLNLYNFFISIYKDQISFAESTLLIYKDAVSINKYNFQVIQNVRNLKFNIRGIPIKNSYDFSTNIKSLTSYLTNYKNFLLLDIKNYFSHKKIVKARIRAAAKRIRSKIYLNNSKTNNTYDNKEKSDNNIDNQKDNIENIENGGKREVIDNIKNKEIDIDYNNNESQGNEDENDDENDNDLVDD